MIEENFRSLENRDVELRMRNMKLSPFILVKKNGESAYANTHSEKDYLIDNFEEGDKLLFAWAGRWRTDVFSLTKADLKKYY